MSLHRRSVFTLDFEGANALFNDAMDALGDTPDAESRVANTYATRSHILELPGVAQLETLKALKSSAARPMRRI